MKLSIALLSACVTAEKTWFTKEWQVIEAYDNNQDIRLVDPNIRRNKQWHDCGAKPATPFNGRDVVCSGTTCAAVCPIGNFFLIFGRIGHFESESNTLKIFENRSFLSKIH